MATARPGFLTIRGGKWRGKKIAIPDGGVRPTTDKMREQIFNLIDQHFRRPDGRTALPGARILDAFAGTGALGLEALSRGAGDAIAWDISAQAVKAMQAHGLQAAHQSALHPPMTDQAADLIFLDPPYGKGLVLAAINALQLAGWICEQTLLVVETEAGLAIPQGFQARVKKSAGQSQLWMILKA